MSALSPLEQALFERILVVDGAMGTALQDRNLNAGDFGGDALEGCNEVLVETRPDVVLDIHRGYLRAGCDIVETNTFGGTPLVLDEYGLGARAHELNLKAARLAKQAAQEFSTPERPRFVAGSMGPTTKAISVTGGVSFDALIEHYAVQARALIEGGSDYLLLETCQDTRNVKAGLLGIDRATAQLGLKSFPTAVSGTIEPMGTMLAGQSVEALATSLAHRDLLYVGLNCATGPEFMTDHLRALHAMAHTRLACVPNAGLPDSDGCYVETPAMVSSVLERFLSAGWLNVIGGCCGTHAGHIEAMVALAARYRPRNAAQMRPRSALAGVDYLEITDADRPVIVGERTNVIGSRKFKELIVAEQFEEASEVARAQVKSGSQIVDVCLANPDRDELADMERFLAHAVKKVRVPLMLDSTDEKVLELALKYCQGKAIINSINLEDGEERFEKVIPLARSYGAALVVGTIDDDPKSGMGVTRARKLEIAERAFALLTEKYGVRPEDIYWDPLVFPCATGDQAYVGSAVETIEGIRLIKARFPNTRTVLGISNVSFGLPAAGREVLNSVFLYHCVQAGLDLAIVNSEKLVRFAQIPDEERKLAEDLLWNRGADPVAAFAAHFRTKKPVDRTQQARLPLLERLPRYIIEGTKEGLLADLELATQEMAPLEIINGPLMRGMDEVGRLFNTNQLIVAEVLQSAEAMKAAVAYLEPKMTKTAASLRGKVLLATVKGDVHDIGKNLVEIILANNGFEVINLGIKIPPEQLVAAIRQHQPDIVGLSGLLVKSAQQMVVTAEDLTRAGIHTPILVGGAALSETFVDRQIAPAYPAGTVAYASDAMSGLDLAKQIVEPERRTELEGRLTARRQKLAAQAATKLDGPRIASAPRVQTRSSEIARLDHLPSPPDWDRHVVTGAPLDPIWRYINPLMLYGRHLGIKGGIVKLLDRASRGDTEAKRELVARSAEPELKSAQTIWDAVESVKAEHRTTRLFRVGAVYRFFRAAGEGNRLRLWADGREQVFEFPRQAREQGLCLSDYAEPLSVGATLSAAADSIALFVVTCGEGVRAEAERLKQAGRYLESHIVQALALETAEAYAELLHGQMRRAWGFPDAPETTMLERFQAKYRGKRYSFGYPACPRLDDQQLLFQLIDPTAIGVQLTDGFMMDPEASVSAIVFHHPQATYFSVGASADTEGRDAQGAELAVRGTSATATPLKQVAP